MPETLSLDLSKYESPNKDKTPNVKKLWSPEIPEHENELPFNPERDITKEDWEGMKNEFQKLLDFSEWLNLALYFAKLKIIKPKINLTLTNETKQEMNVELKNYLQDKNWKDIMLLTSNMKIIEPKINFNLTKKDWDELWKRLEQSRDGITSPIFPRAALAMKILDPISNINLNKGSWRLEVRVLLKNYHRKKLIIPFYELKMIAKILEPEIDLNLQNNNWDEMNEELKNIRHTKKWDDLATLLEIMTVLAADKVEITDQGLKITMPKKKPKITQASPLPAKLKLN